MPSVSLTRGCLGLVLVGALWGAVPSVQAQVVPGTGNLLNYDDLEDANWGYTHNFPKSSKEEDENIRYPLGASYNRMWSESPKRGAPDVVKRTETPAGGLPGSTGSLYLRTRDCGIPGRPGHKQAQDDFILSARPCGVGYSPNFVVRVYVPEFKDWEQRQGVSFGIRAGLQGMMTKQKPASMGRRLFGGSKMQSVTEMEPYYPGFFIAFNPVKANPAYKEDHAQILIRSDGNGHEVAGPKITQTGWWTFGMSVTSDSRCHYYAHAGIANLTAKDHLYSSLPYGIRGDYFNTIFFNVCSADDASTWSTPWIIDDPKVFYSGQPVLKPAQQQAQQPQPVKTAQTLPIIPDAHNASMSKEIPAAPAVQAPVQPGSPVPMPMPDAPAVTPSVLMPPVQTTPGSVPAASETSPVAPATPIATPPLTPVNTPATPSTPPALLSTEPSLPLKLVPMNSGPMNPVQLNPVQPLQIPGPAALKQDTAPLASGRRLTLRLSPSPESPPTVPTDSVETEAVKTEATVPPPASPAETSESAAIPESNPFDDAKTANVKSVGAKSGTEPKSASAGETNAADTPSSEEPPLVLPKESDDSVEVDPAPVPMPPAE